jgi:hypothetical protein
LKSASLNAPIEVVFALQLVNDIAFRPSKSIDRIVSLFCEHCGCESELLPLLLFALKNHFGEKNSSSTTATGLELERIPHLRGECCTNVIQVVMSMAYAALCGSGSDDMYPRPSVFTLNAVAHSIICRLCLCARDLVNILDDSLVPFIMLRSLQPSQHALHTFAVAASALAAALPRAVLNMHMIAEFNSVDLNRSSLSQISGSGLLDVARGIMLHSSLLSDGSLANGFPDAAASLQVYFWPVSVQLLQLHSVPYAVSQHRRLRRIFWISQRAKI